MAMTFMETVREEVERGGCPVISIGHEVPTYAYTIGLWQRHRHPELVMVGLEVGVMAKLLKGVARLIDGGAKFSANDSVPAKGDSSGVSFRTVDKTFLDRRLSFGIEFYEAPFPVLELVSAARPNESRRLS